MPFWPLRPDPGSSSASSASFYLALGAFAGILTTSIYLSLTTMPPSHKNTRRPLPTPSPLTTHLPNLTPSEIAALPYPPNVLPGARSVPTPYGTIHVFEFGPEEGEKVLLLHGISTPCLALGTLASALAAQGYRVMLFDFFGRGYSDTPPEGVEFDLALYTSQILLVLASSRLAWTGDEGFHLVGYSLGGGLAVGFARFFGRMCRSVTVVAGGGLIRGGHVSWRSRVLYGRGWVPEGVRRWVVRRRLMPLRKDGGVVTETKLAGEVVREVEEGRRERNSDASGGEGFDDAVLLAGRPEHTVSGVMGWQLRHHEGFIEAFVSSIRYAPIYDQKEDWAALGRMLAERRERAEWEDTAAAAAGETLPGLRGGKILFVLGASDPVIVKEELIHDATAVLGEDGFEAVVLDAGHEVVMTKGAEVAAVMASFWRRMG